MAHIVPTSGVWTVNVRVDISVDVNVLGAVFVRGVPHEKHNMTSCYAPDTRAREPAAAAPRTAATAARCVSCGRE
eukprot:365801-Chlamydomonas_euryale.AAC.3